ncbi:MAG TPA: glycosyltransferase family 39 protein [Thermoflexus sp.]|nr:glycosyltransferase family 39 protein [Thermoflexus sp.]
MFVRRLLSTTDRLALESLWILWATASVLWSLMASGLAQMGRFRPFEVALAGGLAALGGWGLARWERRAVGGSGEREKACEGVRLGLLLLAGLFLFAWPAEHFPLLGDSAIYPNTAAALIRTGGLVYHYTPLDGLAREQKELFYIPAERQVPGVPLRSYRGLLYGAYYVMDPDQNQIVSSRQPVAIVWMGGLGLLAGPLGMLYVTPFFGAASLAAVYFLGRQVFGGRAGALAGLWLLLSFPQLHFSRTSYAEAVGQFFVLVGLYGLVRALQTGWVGYSGLGLAAWAVAFAARIEVLLVLPTLALFLVFMARRYGARVALRDSLILAAAIGFAVWTLNRPYAGATGELLLAYQFRFLKYWNPWVLSGALGAGLLIGVFVFKVWRNPQRAGLWGILRYGFVVLLFAAMGYSLFLRPWVERGGPEGHHAELMPIAALYLSPFLFGLAGLGSSRVVLQRPSALEQWLLLLFGISFSIMFFWKYTTARVYPVALRRWMPEVLPLLVLLGAWGLRWMEGGASWRRVGRGLAYLTCIWLVGISGPYWMEREGRGTWAFIEALERQIPKEAVLLFEPLQGEAIVGWFAAPLWSFSERDALLLNREVDREQLERALHYWRSQGRPVYVLAQRDPTTWWPGPFPGHQVGEVRWRSSLIGQSMRFPPVLWRFDFRFMIYRLSEGT